LHKKAVINDRPRQDQTGLRLPSPHKKKQAQKWNGLWRLFNGGKTGIPNARCQWRSIRGDL